MRLLLDTHIAVWAITDDPRLGAVARELIADETHDVFVSAVSLLEIALKRARRPESIPITAAHALLRFEQATYLFLPILPEHAASLEDLPPIHSDPFDRLLAAQALKEPMRLMTRDRTLASYSGNFILA
jgi:PIN domain nuclease of toxin-antitoxin system